MNVEAKNTDVPAIFLPNLDAALRIAIRRATFPMQNIDDEDIFVGDLMRQSLSVVEPVMSSLRARLAAAEDVVETALAFRAFPHMGSRGQRDLWKALAAWDAENESAEELA